VIIWGASACPLNSNMSRAAKPRDYLCGPHITEEWSIGAPVSAPLRLLRDGGFTCQSSSRQPLCSCGGDPSLS